jgi:hypothetical protein
LSATTFNYSHQPKGIAGYRQFMSWVKAQMIAGNQVTIGILDKHGTDPQYDHEVSVIKIGTNHAKNDSTYYDDDVLYFDDHGGVSLIEDSPSIPSGAGDDVKGCMPYIVGYTFESLANTREGANAKSSQEYSIIIPGVFPTFTKTGWDGVNVNPAPIVGANYGFSVSGPADSDRITLAVTLEILNSTTGGVENPFDPVAGYNYENPMIGTDPKGNSCTNSPPKEWMNLILRTTVSGLKPGTEYNLYEYDFDQIEGVDAEAALAVPTAHFNERASEATHVTRFVADGPKFSETLAISSNKIVVFRCVPASAP